MKIGELFSGYGGLGMGVQSVLGGEVVWHSDIDKGACKILAHRYPDAPNLGDITTVDWSQVEPVDVLTGGSPCQDVSGAGKRGGMTEGTRSNLWVAMREAIAQLRPGLVVWENVGGAASAAADSEVEPCAGCVGDRPGVSLRALGRVVGDLSSLGYVGRVGALRASDIGAPHGRLRYFLVAHAKGDSRWLEYGDSGAAANDDGTRRGGVRRQLDEQRHADRRGGANRPGPPSQPPALLPSPRTSDTNGAGAHGDGGLDLRTAVSLLPTPAVNDMGAAYTPEEWDVWTERMKAEHGNGNGHGKSLAIEAQRLLPTPKASNFDGSTRDDFTPNLRERVLEADGRWGDYAAAIARWEHVLGRPAPPPTQPSKKGAPQLSPAFVEWLMGLPAGWVTDVPGITRNEALKALGNGVVPAQAAAAIRTMLSWQVAA